MAQIKLYEDELDDLPDICAKSGEPTTNRVRKTFSWQPGWVAVLLLAGLLPYVIVALIMTKRMTVEVPLSERHANHWLGRTLLILGGFLAVAALGIVSIAFLGDGPPGDNNPLGGVLCGGTLLGLVAWLIMAVVLQQTSIRPMEITNESITLAGVSREFANAMRERQQEQEERYEEERRLRRMKRREPPSTEFRE